MSDESNDTPSADLDAEVAAAVIAAVILHRASVENEVRLLEGGLSDEGFWGRSGRAGTASVLTHRPRRAR